MFKDFLKKLEPAKIIELAKRKPIIFFISLTGFAVVFVILTTVLTAPPPIQTIPAGTLAQDNVNQNAVDNNGKNDGQNIQQNQQATSTSQQGRAAQLPVISWQGISPVTTGPIIVSSTNDVVMVGLSGTQYGGKNQPKSMILDADTEKDFKGDENTSVTFPLGGRYKTVSFNLMQKAIKGNIDNYAHTTVLRFLVDGIVHEEIEIRKDQLLSNDMSMTIPTEGVGQLALKIETKGYVPEGAFAERDKDGPFFSVVLGNLYFEAQMAEEADDKAKTKENNTSEDNKTTTDEGTELKAKAER